MADALIVRRGGLTVSGGGIFSANAAVLHVLTPVGSTVTIAKGSATKVCTAGKSHTNNRDTGFADYYFSLAASEYGTWTVTAALGSDTASKTVAVSTNRKYDVELSYYDYFYNLGDTCDAVTGGYIQLQSGDISAAEASALLAYNTDNVEIGPSSNTSRHTGIATDSMIDLTNYSTLFVDYTSDGEEGQTYTGQAKFGVTKQITRYSWYNKLGGSAASATLPTAATRQIASLDVSELNGTYNIAVWETGKVVKVYALYAQR